MKVTFLSRVRFILITCILIPGAFLLLLEFTLRATGYGYPSDFFIKDKIKGKEFYINNYKFSWRFFPKPMARLSSSLMVPVKKDEKALRVFVFGESAAQGDPEPSFSFSRILETMLEKKYPDRKIEIYNTAITAINSNVIVPMVHDCLKLEPDLFIVYMGNNEVIGPYGLSSALTPFFSSHIIIKAQIWLGETKIGQLIRELSAKDNTEEWKGMELFIKNKVQHSSPDLETIYNHFSDNVNEIIKVASQENVKVILSTVITNERDCVPFLSLHNKDLNDAKIIEWRQLYNNGVKLDSSGQYQQALEFYQQATALDDEYAVLNFRMGKCYLSLNQPEKAKAFFSKARDYDALRFRADARINKILNDVASDMKDKNVYLADADDAANKESNFGIPGSDLLYEHVHLNFKGNYLLAKTILPQVEKAFNLLSALDLKNIEETKMRLAYTAYDEKRICEANLSRIQGAPFTNQYTNKKEVRDLQKTIQNIDTSLDSLTVTTIKQDYEKTVSAYSQDWFLHLNFLRLLYSYNYLPEAAHEAKLLYDLIPYEYISNINMGTTLRSLKKFKESKTYYERAIAINPYFSEAYRHMALFYEDQKMFYRVPYYLIKSRSTTGEFAIFYNKAGVDFAKKNMTDSAIAYFNKAVTVMPTFLGAQQNLAQALKIKKQGISPNAVAEASTVFNKGNTMFEKGDFEGAILTYDKALKLNPNFPRAHNNMAIAYIQLNKFDDALQHFLEAVKLDPKFFDAYPNIAMLFSNQGRHQEAIDVLSKAVRINADPTLYHLMGEEYLKMGNKALADESFEQERMTMQLHSKK